eukprot:7525959-Pyramimonas_sp.AAC.1
MRRKLRRERMEGTCRSRSRRRPPWARRSGGRRSPTGKRQTLMRRRGRSRMTLNRWRRKLKLPGRGVGMDPYPAPTLP